MDVRLWCGLQLGRNASCRQSLLRVFLLWLLWLKDATDRCVIACDIQSIRAIYFLLWNRLVVINSSSKQSAFGAPSRSDVEWRMQNNGSHAKHIAPRARHTCLNKLLAVDTDTALRNCTICSRWHFKMRWACYYFKHNRSLNFNELTCAVL